MSIWTELYDTEFSLKFVNVNGIRTRVLEAGRGEPLIFLHGTGGHIESHHRNIRAHAKYFHVYVIDMVGYGFTDKPVGQPYTIPFYAQFLLNFMDTMNIEKAHISGQSLGGWVGAWLAVEHPERVSKLVMNTSGGFFANPNVMRTINNSVSSAMGSPTRENVRKRLEHLIHDKEKVTEEMIDVRQAIYSQPEMQKVMEQILVLQQMEVRTQYLLTPEKLQQIKCPVCVIWTTHDFSATPEAVKEKIKDIPDCEFHVIENCAHWPQYEDPETFNKIHIDFLLK